MITNEKLVVDMMNHSAQGALKQAFIIEAIQKYSEMVLEAPDWGDTALVSKQAWDECAKECIESIKNRRER